MTRYEFLEARWVILNNVWTHFWYIFCGQKANLGKIIGGAIRPTGLLFIILFVIIVLVGWSYNGIIYWIYKTVPSNSLILVMSKYTLYIQLCEFGYVVPVMSRYTYRRDLPNMYVYFQCSWCWVGPVRHYGLCKLIQPFTNIIIYDWF